jgi:hypothetical protein
MTRSSQNSRPAATQQTAQNVLMIRPAAFGFNPETAASNRFQRATVGSTNPVVAAREEFAAAVRALRSEGVNVCVVDDRDEPRCPDAVFPNNWVSLHADGTVVLYPMESPIRRQERRRDAIDQVCAATGFRVQRWLDLTAHEQHGRYLEGTGSLVLDHIHRVAYAARSSRTHDAVVAEWCAALGYRAEVFDAADRDGAPVYHTNVLLSIGQRFAVIVAPAIAARDRDRVLDSLAAGGRTTIRIGHDEMHAFCGNVLELGAWDEHLGDCSVLAMSATARRGFRAEAFAQLAAQVDSVLAIPIPTIEALGGGSIRCMLAEVFAPSSAGTQARWN